MMVIKYMIKSKIIRPLLIFVFVLYLIPAQAVYGQTWEVQSIDTMKTSRDQTLYKMNEREYDEQIEEEVRQIKNLGAIYVTVDGAYDEEYVSWLKRWVKTARQNNLRVWYRGNFSGWHGWFGPKNMSRQQHKVELKKFILNNSNLFEDGDIFTACPECEYGGPGNPLATKDYEGFRAFMIEEIDIMQESFDAIGKDVVYTYTSMNPDVAKQIVNNDLLKKLNNTVTLDYFFEDISVLSEGLDYFREKFPGIRFVIGEFGAPIPEINGSMSPNEKAEFIGSVMKYLYEQNDVIGVNYWVSTGGATELFDAELRPTKSAGIVGSYFSAKQISGVVRGSANQRLSGIAVSVSGENKFTKTDINGFYRLPILDQSTTLIFSGSEYKTVRTDSIYMAGNQVVQNMKMTPEKKQGFLDSLLRWLGIW